MTREKARELLAGPGGRIARWAQPNHCEDWDEARDEVVRQRSKETAAQFPGLAKRMLEDIDKKSRDSGK